MIIMKMYSNNKTGWFDRHFGWKKFIDDEVINQSTIGHTSKWDYIGYSGTVALVLILIQATTGIMLLLYYVPDPDKAFGSLQMIRNDVTFGMLYSNIHSINSNLLIMVLFVHMFRIMIISAHRGPREPQWYTGAILLFLMLLTGFSGYLLPWSQQSYWACVIGTESAKAVPLIGDSITFILRGGENVTGATLHRFFALHVSILPILIIILVWIHLKRIWKSKVIAPPDMYAVKVNDDCICCGKCGEVCLFEAVSVNKKGEDKGPVFNKNLCNACRACVENCPKNCISLESETRSYFTEPIFTENIINRAKAVGITLAFLFFCVFFLHGLLMLDKTPADPMATPDKIKPEWYFLGAYQILKELPNELLGLGAILAVTLIVFFLPALDRRGPRDLKKRPVYLSLVIGGIISFIVLTIMGYF
jgi:ubiquinol-cytochrome c reductase cytochrome b subunit